MQVSKGFKGGGGEFGDLVGIVKPMDIEYIFIIELFCSLLSFLKMLSNYQINQIQINSLSLDL